MAVESRAKWVDFGKLLAIIGVIVDHTNGELYHKEKIAYLSYYSVTLFILLMGVTTFWSYNNYVGNKVDKVKKNVLKIYKPYLISVFIFLILTRNFDLWEYCQRVLFFNNTYGSYYVLLYIQLSILAPILIYVLKHSQGTNGGYWIEILFGFVLLIIGSWATENTNILDIYGGGGKLFGGTYLFVFYVGMLFAKYSSKIHVSQSSAIVNCIVCVFFTFIWIKKILWNGLYLDRFVPMNGIINPPNVSILWAMDF